MEKPLISIIVPVYNTMAYLERCVKSLQAQTYEKIEILLIDDGSTDGSGDLCRQIADKDDRIQVYHKENGGSSSARNLGLEKAKGEYIAFVDSDDYVEPDMYERLYMGIVTKGSSTPGSSTLGNNTLSTPMIAQIGRNEIDEQGNVLPDICFPPKQNTFVTSEAFIQELLMHRGDCSFCTKLIHRDLFENRRFPEGLLNEDFHLLIEMLPQIQGILSLPGYAYHVFYRLGSNSRKSNKEDFSRVFADSVDNADFAKQIVDREYPNLKKVAVRFGVFQRLEYLLHIPISQMNKDNPFYMTVVKKLRKTWWQGMWNSHLTFKNKCYQTLFAIAPKTVRRVHKKLKHL